MGVGGRGGGLIKSGRGRTGVASNLQRWFVLSDMENDAEMNRMKAGVALLRLD